MMISRLTRTMLAAALLLVAACSANKPLPSTYYSVPVDRNAVNKEEMSWWSYRFRVSWPEENTQPDFSVDLLLADAIVKPVLKENADKLIWWRFHRRATREAPGHQFSFLFYSDKGTAAKIINSLDSNVLLATMINTGVIKMTISSSTDDARQSDIEAFSDPSWSPEIQKTWPSFIMGASAFWLALIDEIKSQQNSPEIDGKRDEVVISNLLEEYRQVDEEIAEIWQQEGQHVLFHHLSAIFGYKPMRLRKEVIF